jgi:hypothetical protein
VLSEQVDFMFDGMTSVPSRPASCACSGRSVYLPNVPTTAEWVIRPPVHGLVGLIRPAKLPADVLARITPSSEGGAGTRRAAEAFRPGHGGRVNVDTPALQRETRETWERNAGIVKKYDIKN